jgi:hypothetical protein
MIDDGRPNTVVPFQRPVRNCIGCFSYFRPMAASDLLCPKCTDWHQSLSSLEAFLTWVRKRPHP